ncbi:hypothetical protein D9M71_503030 [compost metagenome]
MQLAEYLRVLLHQRLDVSAPVRSLARAELPLDVVGSTGLNQALGFEIWSVVAVDFVR